MLLTLLQDGARAWPAPAVHDTVASIIAQPAYHRALRTSILGRVLRWIGEWLQSLFAYIGETPGLKWVILAATALLALLFIARIVLGTRLGIERGGSTSGGRRRGTVLPDSWTEAERLAAEGRYTDAAHALYRAVIEMLGRDEGVRLHPSKTSGDYARELRMRGSPTYTPFRQFGRRYDRVLFGDLSCDASTYEALRREAEALLRAGAARPGDRAA